MPLSGCDGGAAIALSRLGGAACGMLLMALPQAAPAQGFGSTAWRPDPMPLDASSCAALATLPTAARHKFSLGRAACDRAALPALAAPSPVPPASATAARAQPVQQPLLDPETDPLPPATASSAPALGPAAPAVPELSRTRQRSGRENATTPRPSAPQKPLPQALQRALDWAPQVDRVAQAHALDPLLLHAIARVESRHDPLATSPAGARGMMQVMPGTARRFGVADAVALHDAPTNLEVSARYLKSLQKRFPGDLRLVLAAYNAGEGAVERHGRTVPPFAETQAYVAKVLQEYTRLSSAAASLRNGVLQ